MTKSTLVLGAEGYVGSEVSHYLEMKGHHVLRVDNRAYPGLKKSETAVIDHTAIAGLVDYVSDILIFSGASSVKLCDEDPALAWKINVADFCSICKIAAQSKRKPRIVYASSSSVYGCVANKRVSKEEDLLSEPWTPHNAYDVTKFALDAQAGILAKRYGISCLGLRFGTVNGAGAITRVDVMLNAMVEAAISTGEVQCFNPRIHRPILGLKDLTRAVLAIVEAESAPQGASVYNLASFNAQVIDLANAVGRLTDANVLVSGPPDTSGSKLNSITYDFTIDSSKFCRDFLFEFQDTQESIIESLRDGLPFSLKVRR